MRKSGILLPVFSLVGDYGIGTLGKGAYEFIDFLSAAAQSMWQILPLTPTAYGNSPYQSPGVFAGNPYFIDPEILSEWGLATKSELSAFRAENTGYVDYAYLYKNTLPLLRRAASYIGSNDKAYLDFCQRESFWLEKYCTFAALKERNDMLPHHLWKYKSPSDISSLKIQREIHGKIQYMFFSQWLTLKNYANDKGVSLIGDLPVYPAADSSDYYFSPDMFLEGEEAACPPDSFNINGQLWGNPVYNWEKMKQDGYGWWKQRLKSASALYDSIRIDHFRGFYEYYSVKKGMGARDGKWSKGPGLSFCRMIRQSFPDLDIIAEDLGFLTDETRKFFRESTFDGMKVLLFAFDEKNSEYLPHNHIKNSVVYTGTHDTPTVLQWICSSKSDSLVRAMDYLGAASVYTLPDCFIRGALSSVARRAIIPMQDWLKKGSGARINVPGVSGKNWEWRIKDGELTKNLTEKILSYTEIYNRIPEEQK